MTRPTRPPAHDSSTEGPAEWTPTAAGAHLRGRTIRDTAPEVRLRKALHSLGLRYRLDRRIGRFRPDIVFPGPRVAIFVDGCFWHGCPVHGATNFRGPNADRWRTKLVANRERDRQALDQLGELGWRVVRIWECDIKTQVEVVAIGVYRLVHEAAAEVSS